jgi:hypothetical protein
MTTWHECLRLHCNNLGFRSCQAHLQQNVRRDHLVSMGWRATMLVERHMQSSRAKAVASMTQRMSSTCA